MITFDPSQVLHGTRVPDEPGQDCQRIGVAISLQTIAVNVGRAAHAGAKRAVARKQRQQIKKVNRQRAMKTNAGVKTCKRRKKR